MGRLTSIARCAGLRAVGGSGESPPTLQESECAQILARLIEAATAERYNESAPILQPFDLDAPFPPCKKILSERKRIHIFIVEHHLRLIRVPVILRSERRGP